MEWNSKISRSCTVYELWLGNIFRGIYKLDLFTVGAWFIFSHLMLSNTPESTAAPTRNDEKQR